LEALFIGSAALAAVRLAGLPAPWALLLAFLVILAIPLPIIISKRP
jgi:hypothetical protein